MLLEIIHVPFFSICDHKFFSPRIQCLFEIGNHLIFWDFTIHTKMQSHRDEALQETTTELSSRYLTD
jgi:hypothetical protein